MSQCDYYYYGKRCILSLEVKHQMHLTHNYHGRLVTWDHKKEEK